jgi:hypothetical protein
MKRFGVCMMSLVVVVFLWAVPTSAQDKFIMSYGGGT